MAFKYANLFVVLSISCLLVLGEAHQTLVNPNANWTQINAIVEETTHKVQERVEKVTEEVINLALEDRRVGGVERKCLQTCSDNYLQVSTGVTDVLQDFSKTHDFTMADDYLNHIADELVDCRRCLNDIFKGKIGDSDEFNKWLESSSRDTATQINKLLHA